MYAGSVLGGFFCFALLSAGGFPALLTETFRDPNLAFVAILVGILGVYGEFVRPGLVLPGVCGGLLALLGVSGLAALPVHSIGVWLIGLAAALLFSGALARSRRVWIALGGVALALGGFSLVDGMRLWVAVGAAVPFAAVTGYLSEIAWRARRNKRVRV